MRQIGAHTNSCITLFHYKNHIQYRRSKERMKDESQRVPQRFSKSSFVLNLETLKSLYTNTSIIPYSYKYMILMLMTVMSFSICPLRAHVFELVPGSEEKESKNSRPPLLCL